MIKVKYQKSLRVGRMVVMNENGHMNNESNALVGRESG
jgi:hypothetical protein